MRHLGDAQRCLGYVSKDNRTQGTAAAQGGTLTPDTGLPRRRRSGTRRWSSPTADCASRTAACLMEPSGPSRRPPGSLCAGQEALRRDGSRPPRLRRRAGRRRWGRGWMKPPELRGWGQRRRSFPLWPVGRSAVLACFVAEAGERSLAEACLR